MDSSTGDLILRYGEIVDTSYILIPLTEPPEAQFIGEGASIKRSLFPNYMNYLYPP